MCWISFWIQSPTAGKANNQAPYPTVLVGESPPGLCCGTYAREEPRVLSARAVQHFFVELEESGAQLIRQIPWLRLLSEIGSTDQR